MSNTRICQSCWNTSRAMSLFDPTTNSCVSECPNKYNYNGNMINLVD